jgi:hypothetical protein
MTWDNWIAVSLDGNPTDGGLLNCAPLEPDEDGCKIVMGLSLITDLDGLIGRGAKRVVEVTDIYEPEVIRVLHEGSIDGS